jgi:hypothetical protein
VAATKAAEEAVLERKNKDVTRDNYILTLVKEQKKLKLNISALDSGHAQAQAKDIARALASEKYDLMYGNCAATPLSELFKDLAENSFTHEECKSWNDKYTNKTPCVYALGSRHYIRNLILRYLDIPKDDVVAKTKCGCRDCVNPYHFKYAREKNEKISCGDRKLLVAYRSQGVGIPQIAKALGVHRSTIYRQLGNESVSDGPEGHRFRG